MTNEHGIWAGRALLRDGWANDVRIVCDETGAIGSVETGVATASSGDHIADTILPAPSNLHSHTFQRAMAGLAERRGAGRADSFWSWRETMYRFVAALTPDDIEAVAALAFMEMLEAGYAGVGEFHYLHHDRDGGLYADPAETAGRIVAAAQRTGIGLTLLPVLYQRGGCDGRPLAGGQLRFGNDIDRFADVWQASARHVTRLPGDARIGVAPHSLRAVDADGLNAALALAPDGPIHIHLAEQTAEVDEVRAHHGARPAAWLLANQPVDDRWCLIHATHLDDGELAGIAGSGAVAGLCPVTEANLGDGIFRGEAFVRQGGRLGVGTDSNVAISLAGELRMLEYSQRLALQRRAVLAEEGGATGRWLWQAVCSGGAQALGRASGAIAAGLCADLVEIDTADYRFAGRDGDDLVDTWVFAAPDRCGVRNVWSAGRHVVRDGRHIARDAVVGAYVGRDLEARV